MAIDGIEQMSSKRRKDGDDPEASHVELSQLQDDEINELVAVPWTFVSIDSSGKRMQISVDMSSYQISNLVGYQVAEASHRRLTVAVYGRQHPAAKDPAAPFFLRHVVRRQVAKFDLSLFEHSIHDPIGGNTWSV